MFWWASCEDSDVLLWLGSVEVLLAATGQRGLHDGGPSSEEAVQSWGSFYLMQGRICQPSLVWRCSFGAKTWGLGGSNPETRPVLRGPARRGAGQCNHAAMLTAIFLAGDLRFGTRAIENWRNENKVFLQRLVFFAVYETPGPWSLRSVQLP